METFSRFLSLFIIFSNSLSLTLSSSLFLSRFIVLNRTLDSKIPQLMVINSEKIYEFFANIYRNHLIQPIVQLRIFNFVFFFCIKNIKLYLSQFRKRRIVYIFFAAKPKVFQSEFISEIKSRVSGEFQELFREKKINIQMQRKYV